jgi:PHD/YefM family antitoxin component YafN of YafNO toxin-antitoxin module
VEQNIKKGLKDPERRSHNVLSDRILNQLNSAIVNRHNKVDSTRNLGNMSQLGLEDEVEFNIPVYNRFGNLTQSAANEVNDVDLHAQTSTSAELNKTQGNRKIKTKPIYITNQNFNVIITKVKELKIEKFQLKIISGGLRLMVEDVEDFKKVKMQLSNSQIEFYTFDLADEKQFKVCLYGLPQCETTEVKKAIEAKGLKPADVKQLNIKKRRYDDEAIYIVYFPYGTVNMNQLKSIRSLNYLAVKWSHYIKKTNITQCHRCQQFDHGTRNCNIKPKCVKCGEGHITEKCPHEADLNAKKKEPKCVNCAGNHPANFSGCEKRTNFIMFRKQLAEKERIMRQQKNGQKYTNNHNNNFSLGAPNLYNYNSSLHQDAWKEKDVTDKLFGQQKEDNKDLFSPEQIMVITMEMFEQLSKCSSKYEQISIIAQIATKYISNNAK